MTDEHGEGRQGLPERDVPQAGRPTHSAEARDRPKPDPHASPLGRQPPADAGRDGAPLTGGPSVAGRRGHGATRTGQGPGEALTAENKPSMPRSQASEQQDSLGNEAARTREGGV